MSTSSSTDFSVTRDKIIKGALRLCGVLPVGETPTNDMNIEASDTLNMMVKAWQADGMPLWAIKKYTITLTASTASYRIGDGQTVDTARPLRIIQAYIHNTSSNIDIPINVRTRDEYLRLGNKTSSGMPVQIYYDPQRAYGDLYVYPVPSATDAATFQLVIVYQRPYEDMDNSQDEPDFPQEWYEALKYGLASRLAAEYGVDLNLRRQLNSEAMAFKELALSNGTEEGSLYFGVDRRSY